MERKVKELMKKYFNDEISHGELVEFLRPFETLSVNEAVLEFSKIKDRFKRIQNSFAYVNRIRKFCNKSIGSDVKPYEVVRIVSAKCVEVREMDAVLTTPPELLGIGGFLATHDNSTQRWDCLSNESNRIFKINLTKKGWAYGHFHMSDTPLYYYDYNF